MNRRTLFKSAVAAVVAAAGELRMQQRLPIEPPEPQERIFRGFYHVADESPWTKLLPPEGTWPDQMGPAVRKNPDRPRDRLKN